MAAIQHVASQQQQRPETPAFGGKGVAFSVGFGHVANRAQHPLFPDRKKTLLEVANMQAGPLQAGF